MTDEIEADPFDLSDDQSDEVTRLVEAELAALPAGERCPACNMQTGEDFTCSICHDTGIYPPDSIFRIDPLALAAQAGYDYAGAPKGFKPMYSFISASPEAANFWNACDSRTRRADRLMDALFGPEDSEPTESQSQVVEPVEPRL